ncbi:MAG: bifunctional hydroxymethylpyrimidine kinase/phosphomethylpyrimidine kinase [Clostridiales bacterium]|nr:bifunctional hydroxymethylpyrimidine kinase/phosphomethylpyrimidine kinase [Clostridiales bacterium]
MKTVLSIAGSDCSGGAGIQADLKTMTVHDVYGMTAITALTAQNTTGVTAVMEVSPEFLRRQLDAVFSDIRPDAVKIGMVPSPELADVIAACLIKYRAENIVVDPVMAATSGAQLSGKTAIARIREKLFPLATVITPNIPEAEALSGMRIRTAAEMEQAAKALGDTYGCAVLCKGGHSKTDANDLLYSAEAGTGFHAAGQDTEAAGGMDLNSEDPNAVFVGRSGRFIWFPGERAENPNTHGTGCTLSSAIASNLAKGMPLAEAVRHAKAYLTAALQAGLDLGKGSGPLNHMIHYKNE